MDCIISTSDLQVEENDMNNIYVFLQQKEIRYITYDIKLYPYTPNIGEIITPIIMDEERYNKIISSVNNNKEKYLWRFAREIPISLQYTIENNTININILPYKIIKTINIYEPTVKFLWECHILPELKENNYLITDPYSIKTNIKRLYAKPRNIIIQHDLKKINQIIEFSIQRNLTELTFKKIQN